MSELKRKQKTDFSLSKRKFDEDLNSIIETPVPKPKPRAQKLNEAPELIFKEIFDKNQRNSSGLCIKYKPKQQKAEQVQNPDTPSRKRINLSEIYSSIVPETKKDIKIIEKLQEDLLEANEISNEDSNEDSDLPEDGKAILCCTPSEHTIKIPESYRRQRPIKSRPLTNT